MCMRHRLSADPRLIGCSQERDRMTCRDLSSPVVTCIDLCRDEKKHDIHSTDRNPQSVDRPKHYRHLQSSHLFPSFDIVYNVIRWSFSQA